MSTNEEGRYIAFARQLQMWRNKSKISLGELARRAGISKSNLSRLESGEGNPSLETLWSLSKALDINVRELISPQPSGIRIDRGTSQFTAEAELANFKVSMLSSCPIGSTRDIYRAEFQPGEAKVSEPHGPNVIEHFILISGEARVGPAQDPVVMQPGDYITFSGNQSHVYEALEENTTAIVVMEYA